MKKARPRPAPRAAPEVPALGVMHPAAARWIGALIRMTAPHPAMTQILDVIERLQDNPFRTNFVLLGEPGTGKEGLARALHHLISPGAPLVRLDVAGFPEEEALARLCGIGERPGAAEEADGGALLVEEIAGLGARVQTALLRLLKSGHCERVDAQAARSREGGTALPARAHRGGRGTLPGSRTRSRLRVQAMVMSDQDLPAEVKAGRFRHDLYYRLARIVLWLPPLRERPEDIAPAALWMGNRILGEAGLSLELMAAEEFQRVTPAERAAAVELDPSAIRELEGHAWPGNLRELEAVLERALLLYRSGAAIRAAEIRAALGDRTPAAIGHS